MKKNSFPVWSWWLRALHWVLVLLVALAWYTGGMAGVMHDRLGYAAMAVVILRLWPGFCGEPYARFSQFVHGPRPTWRYTRNVIAGHASRYLGHNPLGAWMVLALLGCVGALGITGFLYTTDWLWGYAWLANLHWVLAWLLLGLIALHLCGVLFSSWRHRENLFVAMLSGHKRPPQGRDIT